MILFYSLFGELITEYTTVSWSVEIIVTYYFINNDITT